MHEDGTETFKYVLDFDHFKVSQFSNNELTLVMNPTDSLYYENGSTYGQKLYSSGNSCFSGLKNRSMQKYGRNIFADHPSTVRGEIFGGVKQAIGLGFWYPTQDLFGIPERESGLKLQDTTDSQPY